MAKRTRDIDFEAATDIFVDIFPGTGLAEVLEHAERGQRNSVLLGNAHEAEVFEKVAAIIRRRLAN